MKLVARHQGHDPEASAGILGLMREYNVARVKMTESERLIMLADGEGWPVIKEDYDHDDVLIQDGREYIWFKHKDGTIIAASDNLGPKAKPLAKNVEVHIRARRADSDDQKDWRRRAGFGDVGR